MNLLVSHDKLGPIDIGEAGEARSGDGRGVHVRKPIMGRQFLTSYDYVIILWGVYPLDTNASKFIRWSIDSLQRAMLLI